MVSWIDIMPTILDWTDAPRAARLRVARAILVADPRPGATVSGWDRVFASHRFHEIQQYYPMRALRTREYKYIVNLAAPLSYPIAGDIESSPSWHAIQARPTVGFGARTVDAFLHRPAEELYDLGKDPRRCATSPLILRSLTSFDACVPRWPSSDRAHMIHGSRVSPQCSVIDYRSRGGQREP